MGWDRQADLPTTHPALGWQQGLPVGQESPQSGPFLFHLGREAAATFLAGHPDIAKGSKEALLGLSTFAARLPSPEQPCIPAQGKLLLRSPSPQPREILQVHMVVLQGKLT